MVIISVINLIAFAISACKTNCYMFTYCAISSTSNIITKTCLYNIDPLKPHFYIVKLGFTGLYIIFLISVQNIDFGYSLEPPRRTHNLCFDQKYEKYPNFYLKIFIFRWLKCSVYLNRRVFVMLFSGYAFVLIPGHLLCKRQRSEQIITLRKHAYSNI